MKFIITDYISNQFTILPAIGVAKPRGVGCYKYSLSAMWGFWSITIWFGVRRADNG